MASTSFLTLAFEIGIATITHGLATTETIQCLIRYVKVIICSTPEVDLLGVTRSPCELLFRPVCHVGGLASFRDASPASTPNNRPSLVVEEKPTCHSRSFDGLDAHLLKCAMP